jgi:glutathione S-transferase
VDTYLAGHSGPFFGGADLNATDAAFAPKLYHAIVALQHFKGWDFEKADVAGQFPALAKYWFGLQQLPAWKKTDYGKPSIIKGWERHMAAGH